MAPLTICRWSNFPTLFQRLADLGLGQLFLLRKILMRITWLAVLGDKLLRLHIVWLPIEIENLIFGPHLIFRVTVAIKTPGHAVQLGYVYLRYVLTSTVSPERTD